MAYRKLIKFGNASHIVSLPKRWLEKNKLNKGDTITLTENSNNELILSTENNNKNNEQKSIVINLKDKPITTIKREVMHAYINNYDTIKIIGDLKRNEAEIKEILNNLVALEIMEETSSKIVVKDFLSTKDVSIRDIIRRIDLIIRSMLKSLTSTNKENSKRNFEDIKNLDKGVNKLRFLLYRTINKAIRDPSILKDLDIKNYYELISYRLLVYNLEEIADECRRSARFMVKADLKNQERKDLKNIYSDIETSYLDVMKALHTKNKDLAHKIASQRRNHIKICDEFFEKSKNKTVGALVEKLKALEGQIRSVARTIIDMEFEDESH